MTIIDDDVSAVVRGDIAAHGANLSLDLDKLVPSYLYWSPSKVSLPLFGSPTNKW